MTNTVPEVFNERDFDYFQRYAIEHHEALKKLVFPTETSYGALQLKDTPELRMFHEKLLPLARKIFNNDLLIPTWQYLNINAGPQTSDTSVPKEDADYVISVIAYQKLIWEQTLDDQVIELYENEGLFFTSNQTHKYLDFPDPFNNVVANAFFFFVQP